MLQYRGAGEDPFSFKCSFVGGLYVKEDCEGKAARINEAIDSFGAASKAHITPPLGLGFSKRCQTSRFEMCFDPSTHPAFQGCWVLGAGCWVLGAGCWVQGAKQVSNPELNCLTPISFTIILQGTFGCKKTTSTTLTATTTTTVTVTTTTTTTSPCDTKRCGGDCVAGCPTGLNPVACADWVRARPQGLFKCNENGQCTNQEATPHNCPTPEPTVGGPITIDCGDGVTKTCSAGTINCHDHNAELCGDEASEDAGEGEAEGESEAAVGNPGTEAPAPTCASCLSQGCFSMNNPNGKQSGSCTHCNPLKQKCTASTQAPTTQARAEQPVFKGLPPTACMCATSSIDSTLCGARREAARAFIDSSDFGATFDDMMGQSITHHNSTSRNIWI